MINSKMLKKGCTVSSSLFNISVTNLLTRPQSFLCQKYKRDYFFFLNWSGDCSQISDIHTTPSSRFGIILSHVYNTMKSNDLDNNTSNVDVV